MLFAEYTAQINSILENPSLENLDLLAAFYLGLKTGNPDSPLLPELRSKVEALYAVKRALKFLDRFLVVSGSNNLTPKTKEIVLVSENSLDILAKVNEISGKTDATRLIEPFADRILDPVFHEEFLAYEAEAHHIVVEALIKRLEPVVEKMAYDLPSVHSPKKNTSNKLYCGDNVGKSFISIDLRQANWTSLRHWDPTLPEWETFLRIHLPEGALKSLFIASKNFRQVTLGVVLKKHGAVKMVEATQVMLIKEATSPLVRKLGRPFTESNDEVIFEWRQQSGSPLEKWLLSTITSHLFRITRFRILEKTYDECYSVYYEELNSSKKYTLLRCASPDKIEARLK